MKRGRERICPRAAFTNMNWKTTKIAEIAALPADERYRLLEAAAKRATHNYETDKELTTFTELDRAVNDSRLSQNDSS